MRALLVLIPSVATAAPLAGNVLVAADVPLHPTVEAARADTSAPGTGKLVALRVVRDRGDVVELSTARVRDCADSFGAPYQLTVFVRKDKLVPRAKAQLVKTFADGTAVAFARGAPADAYAFAGRTLGPAQVTLAVPANNQVVELPKSRGQEMLCDGNRPITMDAWFAQRGGADITQMPLSCGLRDKATASVDGTAVAWPAPRVYPSSASKVGDAYFSDVHVACGWIRLRVDEASLGFGTGGSAALGFGGVGWTPKRGKVTWLDGKPAGTYSGDQRYTEVIDTDDRICVRVPQVIEWVCHHKATATRD